MKSIIINFGGQDRVFYFGLGFLGNLLAEENISISDFDEFERSNPFKYMQTLMFHSLAWGFVRVGQEVPFTKLDVINWLDETPEGLQKFSEGFKNSLLKDVPIQNDSKKKVTQK